jgi:hypothetical protein
MMVVAVMVLWVVVAALVDLVEQVITYGIVIFLVAKEFGQQ